MSRWVSSAAPVMQTSFVVVGNDGDARVLGFQRALRARALPPARVVSYAEVLSGTPVVRGDAPVAVRIESPGKDFETERLLLAAGEPGVAPPAGFERGRIHHPRRWYLGFCRALGRLGQQLAAHPAASFMNPPDDIAILFDKRACHQRLLAADVPVPPALGPVESYEELRSAMRDAGCRAVFVKLAHGSSASGAIAYRTDGRGRHSAATTVETVQDSGAAKLYNSRRIRTLHREREIAELVDALAPYRLHVEAWLPKAGFSGCAFDVRVVVIGGRAHHAVARLSQSPMTNLHLRNRRAGAAEIAGFLGSDVWRRMLRAAEDAMQRGFPASLYGGVDVMVTASLRTVAFLEVNAFGDLLPGVLHEGEDTYQAELSAALAGAAQSW